MRFILTLGAGSGTDIGGRLLADRLSTKWSQSVVIENQPGGDGIVGITAFVGAKDDHVLLLSPSSSFVAHPYLHDNLPYRPEDLAPIARVSSTFVGITVPTVSPINSAHRSGGAGAHQARRAQLGGRYRRQQLHVRGLAQGQQARHEEGAVSQCGRCGATSLRTACRLYESAVAIAQPQIEAGKIKLLAVLNTVRTPAYPNIPTVAEADHPTLTIDGLVGLFGPPSHADGAARADCRRRQGRGWRDDPIIKDRLTRTGQLFNPGGPVEFNASIEHQRATVAAAATAIGMKAKK